MIWVQIVAKFVLKWSFSARVTFSETNKYLNTSKLPILKNPSFFYSVNYFDLNYSWISAKAIALNGQYLHQKKKKILLIEINQSGAACVTV